jgi:hypothetical protein
MELMEVMFAKIYEQKEHLLIKMGLWMTSCKYFLLTFFNTFLNQFYNTYSQNPFEHIINRDTNQSTNVIESFEISVSNLFCRLLFLVNSASTLLDNL